MRPRTDCFTTLAQLVRNAAWATGDAPDGLDDLRIQARTTLRSCLTRWCCWRRWMRPGSSRSASRSQPRSTAHRERDPHTRPVSRAMGRLRRLGQGHDRLVQVDRPRAGSRRTLMTTQPSDNSRLAEVAAVRRGGLGAARAARRAPVSGASSSTSSHSRDVEDRPHHELAARVRSASRSACARATGRGSSSSSTSRSTRRTVTFATSRPATATLSTRSRSPVSISLEAVRRTAFPADRIEVISTGVDADRRVLAGPCRATIPG